MQALLASQAKPDLQRSVIHPDLLLRTYAYASITTMPRNLTEEQRIKEIKEYAKDYTEWIKSYDIFWRLEKSILVQELLSTARIRNLKQREIRNVTECLNCMNSFPINRAGFLNTANNSRRTILNNWSNLIHGTGDIKTRMVSCKKALKFFGDSSVQELIAFYNPEIYPIRNSNSNAGLRFFGYDVSI